MAEGILELQSVLSCIESAFKPFRCIAEDYDHKHLIRFRIYDQCDDTVLTVPDIVASSIRHPERLRQLLLVARARVERKGFVLDPWAMPRENSPDQAKRP